MSSDSTQTERLREEKRNVRINDGRSNGSSFVQTELFRSSCRESFSDGLSSSQDQSVLAWYSSNLDEIVLDLEIVGRKISTISETGEERERRNEGERDETHEFLQPNLVEELVVPSFRSLYSRRYVRALARERAIRSSEVGGGTVRKPIGQVKEHARGEEG